MLGYLFGNYSGMCDPVVVQSGLSTRERVDLSDFQQLKQRVDALELACAGLWTMLKAAHGFNDQQLKDYIQAVDAADGTVDGKITPHGGGLCPKCGHKLLSRSSAKCLWCGAPLTSNPLTPGGT
jgi:hypothetical protein